MRINHVVVVVVVVVVSLPGQVIPTSQHGCRKWDTGKTILCLSNTTNRSKYKSQRHL